MKYLESPHIAYLCKSLNYLNYSNQSLTDALNQRLIEHAPQLSAYSISKALFYL